MLPKGDGSRPSAVRTLALRPRLAGHERHSRLRAPGAAHGLDIPCLRPRPTIASSLGVRHTGVLRLVGLLDADMVILAGEPLHVVLIRDGGVARRLVWPLAGRQASHGIVVRGIEEKR